MLGGLFGSISVVTKTALVSYCKSFEGEMVLWRQIEAPEIR